MESYDYLILSEGYKIIIDFPSRRRPPITLDKIIDILFPRPKILEIFGKIKI